jgi:hypothetical protein
VKIEVKVDACVDIIQELARFGISPATMFPGLDGLALEIKSRLLKPGYEKPTEIPSSRDTSVLTHAIGTNAFFGFPSDGLSLKLWGSTGEKGRS